MRIREASWCQSESEFPLSAQVVTYRGPPPYAHRYVHVAGDILLIAIGSALVVQALEDLIDWR